MDEKRTAQSGGYRFHALPRLLFSERIMFPVLWMQKFFLNNDNGTGYIVKCVKL
jgi:hypothetical protein